MAQIPRMVESLNVYRPQRAWVLLTILWLVCNLVYTLIYLHSYRRMPAGYDWLMWVILLTIPPLVFWWIGIIYRITSRSIFWWVVGGLCAIGTIIAVVSLLPSRPPSDKFDSTTATPIVDPFKPAPVQWDDLKDLTLNDVVEQRNQPTGGCRQDASCQSGFSCMKCDKLSCVTAGGTLPGTCYQIVIPRK